ncbi:MAG: energy-coupling factor transporter transmembrane protein EcfT [Neomegalonema sp.]|nr:energy-coupling factor transporter transmembrane protein EcfT [Neomegalonema sp.]
MLSLALPTRTWAHRIPAGLKLLVLLALSTWLFTIEDPGILLSCLLAVGLMTALLGRAALKQSWRQFKPLWSMLALLLIFHALIEDLATGMIICLKIVTLVQFANLVTMTTPLGSMIALVERLLGPLKALGVPARVIALAMGLVIRFTPTLMQKTAQLQDAWRARSKRRPYWRIIVPLTIAAIDDAEQVADAIRARGGARDR